MLERIRSFAVGIAPLLFLVSFSAGVASAQVPVLSFPPCETTDPATLPQSSICEVVVPGSPYTDDVLAYTEPDVKAIFKHTDEKGQVDREVTVHGFYDRTPSGIVFKIRFNADQAGDWTYDIACTMQANPAQTCGVNGLSRSFKVDDPSGAKGFLRRDPANTTKFVYDNGERPFIWGQTYYQIVNHARTNVDSRWKPAVTGSATKGMNKVRLLVSPWGSDPRYNVASKAFQTISASDLNLNRDKLDLEHWRALDQVVSFINGQGVIADLILFHDGDNTSSPFAQPGTTDPSKAQNRRYTRYTTARYAAFTNVIWTLANEYQLVTGASPANNGPWNDLGCLIRGGCGEHAAGAGADPWIVNGAFWRPLSNQNNINALNSNYPCFEFFTAGWASHISLQTKRQTADFEASNAVSRNNNTANPNPCPNMSGSPRLPVINDEYYYVGTDYDPNLPNDPTIAARDRNRHRQASWAIAVTGGFGSTGSLSGPLNCPHGNPVDPRCSPTLYTDWIDEPHYGDIQRLTTFFKDTLLPNPWWQMTVNAARVTVQNNLMRVYALDGQATSSRYLVYAVPNQTSANTGKFNVRLPIDRKTLWYPATFHDPRGGPPKSQSKRVNCPKPQRNLPGGCVSHPTIATTLFSTPTYNDWAMLIAAPSTTGIGMSPDETVWVMDELPAGAITAGDAEGWNWIDSDPAPIGDSLAHQSNLVAGFHQHYFYGATETLPISPGNVLFAYVYLDPLNPPSEVMLQWSDGSWEHRAYWGANLLGLGVNGTNSRRYMGPLPATDQWVRLNVPASSVGLEGRTLNGMAFTLHGGKATWDDAGKSGEDAPPQCEPGVITLQPQSQTIIPGASATLSVAASGTGPFYYQFYQAPVGVYQNPTGISTPTINTGPLTTTKQYWAEIGDPCISGNLASDPATITVQCTAAPQITVEPTDRVTSPGQSTTLSVSATQAVSIQWYEGIAPSTANPIPGAIYPTLTVAPQSTSFYWVRITNGCGIANSVTGTVCVLPQVTAQPTPRTINPGQSTTLTVTAINAATYQWYVGTAPSTATPIGGNSSSLMVSPTTTTNYWVRITNSCGVANSTTVTVTVAPPPSSQITRMQSKSVLVNSQTSITANWNQPTQPGTFLVAVISAVVEHPNFNFSITPPAGWSHAVTSEWTNVKLAIYYLPNNGGARTSETFTTSRGFHDMTLYIHEYSGIVANPLDKFSLAGNDTNSGYVETGFTPTTSQARELVITALSTYITPYTQTEFTSADNTYTEVYDNNMFNLTTAMYEKITTSIGSYGHGATVYAPGQWVGVVATFKGANRME